MLRVVVAALEVVAGAAPRFGRLVEVAVQRQDVVRGRGVGGLGASVQRHGLVALAREAHAAALGPQELRRAPAERERDVLLGDATGGHAARVRAAVPGVDHDGLADEAARRHEPAVALGDLLALAARLGLAHRLQLDQGALADDAVQRQACVALEIDDRALDIVVVHTALGAGVEAQQVELDLQGEDVVAAERRFAQVQEPVAELVPGLDQFSPRVGADDAVDDKAALLLERAHGELGAGPEEAVHALAAQLEAAPAQACLDIEDFFSAVAAGEVAH